MVFLSSTYDIIFLLKKILFSLLFLFGLLFFIPGFSFAQKTSEVNLTGEHIQSFDSKIRVNKDATIEVEEKIVYDFADLQRHGIYRDIPFIKINNKGNPTSPKKNGATLGARKFRLDYSNFSVVDENGSDYQYRQTEIDDKLRLKIGDPDRTITGLHTYLISYKVTGAFTYFSEHDELYWNITGNDWTVPIASSTTEIKFPFFLEGNKIDTACYTGIVGSSQRSCQITQKEDSVVVISKDTLWTSEGITVVVGFPIGKIAVVEPKEVINFWETGFGKFVKTILILALIIVAIFWYIVYPIIIPVKWYLYGRDPKGGQEVRAWFDPPKTKTGRFLSPEEVGSLIDEYVDYRDLSGMIIYLAQKGYLRIEEQEKNDFYFVKRKNYSDDKSLLSHQKYLLAKIFEDGDEVRIKDLEIYAEVQKTIDMIYTDLVGLNYFPKNPSKIRTFYTVIGGLAVTTLNFALAFTAFAFGRNLPRKTIEGVESAKVGLSLKNFLSSQERQLEFQAKNQLFFEKLLPYAVAFGVEKVWAKRFEDIKMQQPDWYQGYGHGYIYSSMWVNSMNSSFSSFRSAATPTSSSSGFSSGFSGGSSGGGGGGGGGGSW